MKLVTILNLILFVQREDLIYQFKTLRLREIK